MKDIGHFIGGRHVPGESGRFGPIWNPATGEQTGRVAFATAEEVDRAVQAAKKVQPAWAAQPLIRRTRVMFRYKELIERNLDELARLITEEHGKTLEDAKGSLIRGLEVVEFACSAPHLLKGEFSLDVGTGVDLVSQRFPLGVCAGITPFNFPAMIPLWMAPLALVTGNGFVLKPSEKDPSCPMRLAELAVEAGVPEGLFNVVNGDREAVEAILAHPDIAAVSFVGSTPVAEHVWKTGTSYNKRVQALGGAKNHMVIMPDADLDQAVEALYGAAYGSAGERCMAVSVAVPIGDEVADRLVAKLAPKVRSIRIGPGTEPGVEMGPLVTREHLERVRRYIEIGVEEGAELVVDGRQFRMTMQGYENGFYIGGSLFDRVTPDMRIYREEIFGPVLSVVRMPTLEKAIEIINAHEYGNGVAIFTRDGALAREFARAVNIGMVGINVPIPVPVAYHSFGGWKRSLFGDHHAHGMEGIRFYTRLKAITSRWPERPVPAQFSMPTLG